MFGLVLGARYKRVFFKRYRRFIPFALLNSFFAIGRRLPFVPCSSGQHGHQYIYAFAARLLGGSPDR
jgi:hypothetical protein